MTQARHPGRHEPRIIRTVEGLADYLDHGVSWLRDRLSKFEAMGFPKYDPILDGWDIKAVDLWIDGRSKLLSPSDQIAADRAALARELGLGEIQSAVRRNKAA